jgi:hypothetical protein
MARAEPGRLRAPGRQRARKSGARSREPPFIIAVPLPTSPRAPAGWFEVLEGRLGCVFVDYKGEAVAW